MAYLQPGDVDKKGNKVVELTALGDRLYTAWIQGSHDSRLQMASDGTTLSMKGNPGRFGRRDNLFNLDFDETIAAANRIAAAQGFPRNAFVAGTASPYTVSQLRNIDLAEGEVPLGPTDSLVLAVSPWVAQELLPGLQAPDDFRPILNAHFAATPPPGAPAMVGLVGGTADWVFAFPDRLSTTTSDAGALMERDTEDLAAALWQDVAATHGLSGPVPPCRLVKERRATFAATPAQAARRPRARTAWSNLFLAGDWTDTGLPATLEGALRSGEAAAALAFAGPGASEAAAA